MTRLTSNELNKITYIKEDIDMEDSSRVVLTNPNNTEHSAQANTEFAGLPMQKIMGASFGEVSNDLSVTFKKTVLIRDYETEVIEATTTLKLDEPLKGVERMVVAALLEIQMEFTAYSNLFFKGLITESALRQRKKELEQDAYFMKSQADSILGPGKIDRFIDDVNLDK